MLTYVGSTVVNITYKTSKGQNIRSYVGQHASCCRKTFTFASKQHPQVLQHFEIHGKTFMV